jgi:hypothetical protein
MFRKLFYLVPCVVLLSISIPAKADFVITNGDFEVGAGPSTPDVNDWYDNNVGGFWSDTWQSNDSWITPNGSQVVVFSGEDVVEGDLLAGSYLYQSIGTSSGESSIWIGFEWGHPDDTGEGRADGLTVSVLASDGSFVADDANDVLGAAGITLLDSASYEHVALGTDGEIWPVVVELDLSGANAGDEIFLRFNNYWVTSTQSWPILDNVQIRVAGVDDPSDMADSSGDIKRIEAWVDEGNLNLTMTVYGVFAPSVEDTPAGMSNRYYYHWLLDTDNNPDTGYLNDEYEGNPTNLETPIGVDVLVQFGWRDGATSGVYAYTLDPLTGDEVELFEDYEYTIEGDTIHAVIPLEDLGLELGQTIAVSAFQEGASNDWQVDWIESFELTVTAVPPELGPVYPGTEGLVAHYAFESDLTDSSGNGLDGTAIGDPTFAAGVEGMALDLNGDDYLDCGGVDEFSFTDAMTLSTWVNIRSVTTAWMAIAAKGENAWRLAVSNQTTSLEYAFSGSTRGWQAATTATELAFDEWYHVAATYDTTVGAQVYIDGVLDASNPNTDGIDTNQFSMLIGENPEAVNRLFDGMLDEIMLYNRALSEGEILYLAGERPAPVDPGSDGLVAYYELENDANDSSGNGLDGTIVGEPVFVEGAVGMGLQLDGVDDYVDLGNDPLFDLTEQVTLSVWVNTQDIGNTENNPWLGKGDTSYMIKGHREGNQIEFFIYDGGWNVAHADVGAEFNGEWHHAAGTFDGEQLIIYVDGNVAVTSEYVGGIAPSTYNVAIGTNTQASGRFSESIFDEAMIYNRALSEGEIRYLAGHRVNLALNPSFEEDEVILDDPDWYSWCTWNPAEGAGSNATIVDTDAVDGTRSLLIEPIGPENWHFIVVSMPIPTEVGTSYTASFWAKAAEARPLGAQWKAVDNSESWGYADFNLTTEWAEYSLTAEALNAETKLEFFCAASEVSFLLDAVSVTEK